MNNRDGEIQTWIGIFIVLGLAVLVSMLSGCASQPRYEAAVQVESSGEQPVIVASFKLVN